MNQLEENKNNILANDLNRIQSYYEKTISYYSSNDPDASLWQARKTAEAICRQIFEQNVSENVGTMTLDKFIDQLVNKKFLPKFIINPLRTIQGYGNYGTHAQGSDSDYITNDYVRPCLYALTELIKWYFSEYHEKKDSHIEKKLLNLSNEIHKKEKINVPKKNTVKQLVRDAVHEITKGDSNYIFTPKEIAEFITKNYQEIHRNAVIPKLISDCTNHPSKDKYPRGEDLYCFVERGKFRLNEPEKDREQERV